MATPEPITRHLKLEVDLDDADQLRALLVSIQEALVKLTEAATIAQDMASTLLVLQDASMPVPDPGMEAVLCQPCEGTGQAAEGRDDCPTCLGHGVVQQLQAAIAQPLDVEILNGFGVPEQREPEAVGFGDVPMPTMPRPPIPHVLPVTIMAGLDPATLCPECRQGKCRNCTKDGQVNAEACPIWAAYLAEVHPEGETFDSWLTVRGLA